MPLFRYNPLEREALAAKVILTANAYMLRTKSKTTILKITPFDLL
jgi:hypothetical protein